MAKTSTIFAPFLLLVSMAGSCASNESAKTANCSAGDKCDSLDLPESKVEASPCDGHIVDKSGRGLSDKIAGRLNDPLSILAFRTGDDCPRSFSEIMEKLKASVDNDQEGVFCDGQRSMVVSETAQPLGEATSYRSVTALDCEQENADGSVGGTIFGAEVGVLFSLFGLEVGNALPDNVEIIAFDRSAGVFNYYETDGDKINFFGNSKDMLKGVGSGDDRRCAACHKGGGLVMKELRAPWLHWEGETFTPGAEDLIAQHADLLGSHSDGADLEEIVRDGNDSWNETRFAHLVELGATKELLRPLFCTPEVNIDSAEESDNGSAEGVASSALLAGNIFNDRLITFGSLDFDPEEYDAVIRANGQEIAGLPTGHIETVFGLSTVVPSLADDAYLDNLLDAGILDDQFVQAVLAVDFTRGIFSEDRCNLLEQVPQIPASELSADTLRAGILTELGNPRPGTPEAELKNNLADPNNDMSIRVEDFTIACEERSDTQTISFTKDGILQTLEVSGVLVDLMKIVSLNRETARGLSVFEFPQTLPRDDQNVSANTRLDPTDCTITTEFVAVGE